MAKKHSKNHTAVRTEDSTKLTTKSCFKISSLVLVLMLVLSVALIVILDLRHHYDRQQVIDRLIAYSQDQRTPSEFSIQSQQNNIRLLGVIPATETQVQSLVCKEGLSEKELEYLLEGDQLTYVRLAHTNFTSDDFQALSNHRRLRRVILSDCELEIHWKEFLYLNSIQSLAFGRIKFPKNLNREIPSDLSHLDHFGMTDQTIGFEDLDFLLQPTAHIRSLALIECKISPEAMDAIARINSLETLVLMRSEFDGSKLAALYSLGNLKSLSLSQTSIKDGDVEFLSEMRSLEEIYLWGCANITVKTRERINTSTNLTRLKFATFGPVEADRNQGNIIPMIDRRQR